MESVRFVKSYCGLTVWRQGSLYFCTNRYTETVPCYGTSEKCNEYFESYKNQMLRR